MLLVRAGVAVVAGCLLACGCSCTGSNTTGSGASGGGAGVGGTSVGGSGGAAGTASGGNGGAAGSGDAGPGGAAGIAGNISWRNIAGSLNGCTFEEMESAGTGRAFSFAQCGYSADLRCEEATFVSFQVPSSADLSRVSFVEEDDEVRVAYAFVYPKTGMSFLARGSGELLSAHRSAAASGPGCDFVGASVQNGRFLSAVIYCGDKCSNSIQEAVLLKPHGGPTSLVPFKAAASGGAQWYSLTATHVGIWEAPQGLFAFPVDGGSASPLSLVDFSSPPVTGQIVGTSGPLATPAGFLATETYLDSTGKAAQRVVLSQGTAASTPIDDGPWDSGSPAYANSYLVWLRGFSPIPPYDGAYETTEVWAAPYPFAGSQPKAEKVADGEKKSFLNQDLPFRAAGHGRFAIAWTLSKPISVWDIASKVRQDVPMPNDTFTLLGITRHHLWFAAAAKPGQVHRTKLFRWRLD